MVTGYGTDLCGEAEVSAWELRRGLRNLGLYVGSLVVMGTVAGLAIAPRRTLRAFFASGGGRGSLFTEASSYDDLLALRLGELRARLGVPEGGVATQRRGVHSLVREGESAAPAAPAGAPAQRA